MSATPYLDRIFALRRKYISERNFLLIVSGLVGLVAGLAAVSLKQAVHFIQHSLTDEKYEDNILQLFYPLVGLVITISLARILYRERLGHAITEILYAISKKAGIMSSSKMYSRWITSAFTVGFGGSAGLESPIVLTGSAIGSNIGRVLHLNPQTRILMIGCGTAGVISAIFNAPIAGLIFSIEVILVEVTVSTFIPLLIASVSATLVSILLLGDEVLFSFRLVDAFSASDIPYFLALAIICGFISMYFNFVLHKIEHRMEKIAGNYQRAIIGGIFLSILIFLCPPVYGEGYMDIKALLNGYESLLLDRSLFFSDIGTGWWFVVFLVFTILVKAVASAVTIGSGGSGGTFAPSLFLGGVTGFAFARIINLLGIADLSESNFTLVGMCGVLCGIQYAPLTAIFLIAELTGGYTLFIPLMLVSAISFSTVSYFNPLSPYSRELLERGDHLPGNHDERVLSKLSVNRLVETDLQKINHKAYLIDLIQLIKKSKRNIFPVVDDHNKLLGVITLDDVRHVMFEEEEQKNALVTKYMHKPLATVNYGETMSTVMVKFESVKAWNLPVVHPDGRYAGFVSKSRIFTLYRRQLIQQTREHY